MSGLLTQTASDLGVEAVGVAPAAEEVKAVYPWACCVVTAAMSYLPPEPSTHSGSACGLVARFARGVDYHDVLGNKLRAMAGVLKRRLGASGTEVCVDRAPLPERKLALAGGIGWLGKNGCVYVEGCGSYVSLGEIVLDIPLEESTRTLEEQCGECRRCLEACPTGALIAPWKLDHERCISHLTQRRGEIPIGFRQAMGNRIYGCDVCQEVCPYNKDVPPVNPEFAREVFPGADPELAMLLEMDRETFEAEVRPSSIGWIGRNSLRRNAAVAAGNLTMREAASALARMVKDSSPVVRSHAEWALERCK